MMKNSQYAATVIDFVKEAGGRFIAVTEDQAFLSVLRTVLNKYLALSAPDILRIEHNSAHILKEVKETNDCGHTPLLLMERLIDGQDSAFIVKQLKTAFPKLLIIILGVEMEQQRVMLMHEQGVDNFIAKPISAQAVIEKLAFTIKPQNQLGQLIDKAKALIERGRAELAKEAARQILELKPNSPAGLMVLGDAEIALGDLEAAKAAYLEAHTNAELYLEPLQRLANLAMRAGNPEESLMYLEKLDSLSPLNVDRKVNMGEINLDLGREEKAEALFEAAVEQVTRDSRDMISDLAERIAGVYAVQDPVRSEKFLRKALRVKKNRYTREDLKIFNQLGMSLRRQGKWQEAVDEYSRALSIASGDENLHYNMGLAYGDGKKMHEARNCMEKALKINENLPYSSATVGYRMGLVFMAAGGKDLARRCFEAALTVKPGMKQAADALAKLN